MNIIKIGAKVNNVVYGFTQSQRLGKFFFIHCHIDFERQNLLTEYSFTSLLSVHSNKWGHSIRYTHNR